MEFNDPIKIVRVVRGNGTLSLDYRTHSSAKLPKGRTSNRIRFSTNKEDSKAALKYVEKHKFELAKQHYESLFDNLENKEEVLFEDIAYAAHELAAKKKNRKKDATVDYLSILEKFVFPYFGRMNLNSIKPKDIELWMIEMADLGISQSRFYKYFFVVKCVLDYAYKNEYTVSNVMDKVKRTEVDLPKSKSNNHEYFSEVDRDKILNDTCVGCSDAELIKHCFINTFMHLALFTGARTGEMLALKWADVDFDNNAITYRSSMRKGIEGTTKTKEPRTVVMIQRLSDVLLKWKDTKAGEYVFPQPGLRIPYKNSRSIADTYYKPMLERLGIRFRRLYSSRHTFASISHDKGIPVATISQCLGHRDTEVTSKYYLLSGNRNQDEVRRQMEKLNS
ncbi:site-specific integrase [Sulfuricurvum sp.]|uniref:tyrosine-type recombinase/integrase n=1 Tax=Sulfuricurvum sp. TaxID=2025608 RepID=UPI00286DD578|nr:site-specific integrase [Sulfuricurvum sp.]